MQKSVKIDSRVDKNLDSDRIIPKKGKQTYFFGCLMEKRVGFEPEKACLLRILGFIKGARGVKT